MSLSAGQPPDFFFNGVAIWGVTKNIGLAHQKQKSAGVQQRGGGDAGKL